jgi:hypothetical protein
MSYDNPLAHVWDVRFCPLCQGKLVEFASAVGFRERQLVCVNGPPESPHYVFFPKPAKVFTLQDLIKAIPPLKEGEEIVSIYDIPTDPNFPGIED